MNHPSSHTDLGRAASYHGPLDIGQTSKEESLTWFRLMVLIRRTEEIIGELVETGEVQCPCHLGIGQEATAVGVATALRSTDHCFGAHRSHGHYLALGGSVHELLAEVLGKATGCSGGFGGSMHLRAPDCGLVGTVPIVGATIPMATGAGLAAKYDGVGDIAVSFFGDGATEEGVFHESLNLASVMKIPVLFVCENNFFSSHLHISLRQPGDSIARYGDAHCIETIVVDGNDVAAVASESQRLVRRMRDNPAPALIEAVTYRWRGHVGHREDEDVGVHRLDDLQTWKGRDPIRRLRDAVEQRGVATSSELNEIVNAMDQLLESALAEARRDPFPDTIALRDVVYPSHAISPS